MTSIILFFSPPPLQALPDSLDQFLLPLSQEKVSELYVVGTQESTGQRREWEVLVQQTLGPSHLLVHSASLGELYLLMFLRRELIWFCSGLPPYTHHYSSLLFVTTYTYKRLCRCVHGFRFYCIIEGLKIRVV